MHARPRDSFSIAFTNLDEIAKNTRYALFARWSVYNVNCIKKFKSCNLGWGVANYDHYPHILWYCLFNVVKVAKSEPNILYTPQTALEYFYITFRNFISFFAQQIKHLVSIFKRFLYRKINGWKSWFRLKLSNVWLNE